MKDLLKILALLGSLLEWIFNPAKRKARELESVKGELALVLDKIKQVNAYLEKHPNDFDRASELGTLHSDSLRLRRKIEQLEGKG